VGVLAIPLFSNTRLSGDVLRRRSFLDRGPLYCRCIAAYGWVQRQLGIQLATSTTGMMIGQQS